MQIRSDMLEVLKGFAVVTLLLSIPSGMAIPLSSFYSYGSAAGDTLLPPNADESSPSITLPAPFRFFGNNYSTLFVNNNGDLSFDTGWTQTSPVAFPIPTYPVVAIYQADVDTRGIGSVSYRITQNAILLVKAANDIRSLIGTRFSPQWLFIATWDHVGYYSYGINKTNTFQVVLATDNVRSYAIFLYADGLIQWPSSGAQVGFNAGNNVNYVNIPGSRTPSILNITNSSNVEVGGQWVFLISQAVPSCGAVHNYSEGALVLSGYVKCYDQPYSSYTTTSDLAACNDTQIVFVGAKRSSLSTVFEVGAFGSPYVFTTTSSTVTAYYDPGGAYWYRYPSFSFGFANSSSVSLTTCDNPQGSSDCVSRLCWHLDQHFGGWRAGCTTGLNDDQTWRKVIYKGNNSSTICNQDRDECALGISGCNQICTNTNGSYVCSCYRGYKISSNLRTCMDINECTINNGNCSHLCTNNVGSYTCSCITGYMLSVDEKNCIEVETECQKPPTITVHPESVSPSLGSQVTLQCQASGCPSPQITWYKDNAAISNGPYLVIQEVTLSERGFYACKAVNVYGYVSSSEVKLSIKGVYQYSAYLELNNSATFNTVTKLRTYLTGRSVVNNSANIIIANISYSGTTISALITLAGNNSLSYDAIINEIYNLLSAALEYDHISTIEVQRFDGCPLVSVCNNKYKWPETEIGSIFMLSPCVNRRCGGTYSTGGQWEAVILTCNTDYVSCAVSELEDLLDEALNNTEVASRLLSGVDSLINSNDDATYQSQDADRLLTLLNYYSNNAIINETTLFTGKVFASQLEDINISKGCFTGRSFSVNLGSFDMAAEGNTTIDKHAIGSNTTESTTASVYLLPLVSNNCSNTESPVYRLTFYTFLKDTLFQSPQQEKENFKLGSIILSVGGSAVSLGEKLQFSFQVSKDAIMAYPAQWTKKYINGSYQVGIWSTDGSRVISKQNNIFRTETLLTQRVNTRQSTSYQENFGMLLDLNPGGMSCPAAEILTIFGTIISIISLLLFLFTYLYSKNLRRSEHGQVLINISCALLCLYVAFLVAGNATSVPAICGISAALVHYFMLVYFMWTLAEAVFLYMKLVKVLGNHVSRFSLKAGLVSWLVPLAIVIVSAGAGYRYYYNQNYCRATDLPFYLGFILPFILIYVFNWITFVVIMISIWKHSASSTVKKSTEEGGKSLTIRNVVIAAGLALVLGLGWGFGLAASSHNISALACAFQFVFSLFVSCQGLLLLIFHGVRNKDAKVVWRSWFGLHSKSYSIGMSSLRDGGTMQKASGAITTHSTMNPPMSFDESTCSKAAEDPTAIATASEEKIIAEASSGNNSLHGSSPQE